ncbi:protein maelstrom 1 [Anastrepha obliqua]|uniref:protein maelstrom 1 n=1 Tax=Anastrepha obliqua TaxID=95512 RepID=UPI00240A859C|nr:protein maelstrom 1 [Anastrepha obliqua]XP_054727574.1 protein maelstrom 1 [Anastrepha obliqua]
MRKNKKPNGFITFTNEWKSKYGKRMTLSQATEEAGKIWISMSMEERSPYNERAKQERSKLKSAPPKLTCTGKPLDQVEKDLQVADQWNIQMKRNIEMVVRNSVNNDQLKTQSYFFVMVNYFVKSLRGDSYVPAEISVAEYSLQEGVCRKYHTLINPGRNLYGLQFDAQDHADRTHKLPLPPNALGEENLGLIYNHVLDFVRDPETGDYPPIYTHRDSIPIVKSVLDFLKNSSSTNVELKVYSIQYLFFILKEATAKEGDVRSPKCHYITDACFDRDFYEYQTDIACNKHEEMDKSKYCTQSCVTRWGYIFSDFMCGDVAISVVEGRHKPIRTDVDHSGNNNPAPPSTCFDTESQISGNSESTYATRPFSENRVCYDDHKTFMSAHSSAIGTSTNNNQTNDFPYLGARKKTSKITSTSPPRSSRWNTEGFDGRTLDLDLCEGGNPWSIRSRDVPREPDTSHFDINYTRDETTDNDRPGTSSGYGRGRMRMNHSATSNTTAGSGRGRLWRNPDYRN